MKTSNSLRMELNDTASLFWFPPVCFGPGGLMGTAVQSGGSTMWPKQKRSQVLRIGELARLTGTTPKAIRLYEARGLMGAVARQGSYRQYGDEDVARVQLIRKAQALGFRLAQLDGLAQLHTPQGWSPMAALLKDRRAAVAKEMRYLQQVARQLAELETELLRCDAAGAPLLPVCEALVST